MGNRPLWLIARQGFSGLEVFTIGRHVLPVFSFREEVEAFLHFSDAADGWRARETTSGELVSVLYGPCRDVEHISLDPLPEIVEPVNLSRKDFFKALLGSDTSPAVEEPQLLGVAS